MKKKPATSTKVKKFGKAVQVRKGTAATLHLPQGWKKASLERLINSRKFLRMNKEAYKARQDYYTAKGFLKEKANDPEAVLYGQQLLDAAIKQLKQFPELESLIFKPQQKSNSMANATASKKATATKKATKKAAAKKAPAKKAATKKVNNTPPAKKATAAAKKTGRMVLSVDQVNGIRKELVKGDMTYKQIKEKYGLHSFTPIAHIKKNKMVTKEDLK